MGHLYRKDDNRLTKQFFKYLWVEKSTSNWVKEIKKNLERNRIKGEEANKREFFRIKVLRKERFKGRNEKNWRKNEV